MCMYSEKEGSKGKGGQQKVSRPETPARVRLKGEQQKPSLSTNREHGSIDGPVLTSLGPTWLG